MEAELPGIIELPGPVMEDEGPRGICLGSSEGYFHYICVNSSEIRVWASKDYCKRAWVLKHRLNLVEFSIQNSDLISKREVEKFKRLQCQRETLAIAYLLPRAFYEAEYVFLEVS